MTTLSSWGVGTDIESILRFKRLDRKRHATFFERVYTPQEIEYCYSFSNPAAHLAVRFCAKEAVVKALHTMGRHDYRYLDIEIILNEHNVPEVKLDDVEIRLSLSHSDDTAMAFAVVEVRP